MSQDEVFFKETEVLRNLRALEAIESNPKISQRELAGRLGAALGITNALLKALARKGLIKIRGANNRSFSYHLTHAGVLAKSHLAMRWTLNTIDFYRQARRDVAGKLMDLSAAGVKRVFLYGIGELTEIALIVAPETGLEVAGIIDCRTTSGTNRVPDSLLGCPLVDLGRLAGGEPESVVVCVELEDEEVERLDRCVEAGSRLYSLL
jgi:DNA-binding Lrp family transcriptional regulator